MKVREPLTGAELQPVTEKWLVLEAGSLLSPPERAKERVRGTSKTLEQILSSSFLKAGRTSWKRSEDVVC